MKEKEIKKRRRSASMKGKDKKETKD